MNIADIPQELYEYYLFQNLLPHCNLINSYIKFIDITEFEIADATRYHHNDDLLYIFNDDIDILITELLCFYNNKSLYIFYQSCHYLNLNMLLCDLCYEYCIKYNYFHTFKWHVNNDMSYINNDNENILSMNINDNNNHSSMNIYNVCIHLAEYNRSHILKWLMENDHCREHYNNDVFLDKDIFFQAAYHNSLSIIKLLCKKNFKINNHDFSMWSETYNDNYASNKIYRLLRNHII